MKLALACLSLAVVGGALAAAGCSSEKDESKSGAQNTALTEAGIEAKEFFTSRVYPNERGVKTACGGCHSGTGGGGSVFLGADADASYSRIENTVGLITEPGRSPLLIHLHNDKTITLTPELRSLLTQWLNLEATARGLTGSIKPAQTLSDAYKAYAQCMNFDVWTYFRVGDLPYVQTDLDGPCLGCHSTGQGGAYLTSSSREFFEKSKEFPFIQKFVVGQVDGAGNFDKLIPANRFVDKANEVCAEGRTDCHPTFGLPPNVSEGVTNFIFTTLQNLAGGTCQTGVPTLGNPDAGADAGGKK